MKLLSKDFWKSRWDDIRGNFLWWCVYSLISLLVAYGGAKHVPFNLFSAVGVFVVSVVVLTALGFAWRAIRTQSPPLVKESDPQIYVDIIDARKEPERGTPFVLHNRGKAVAHKVQILPLKLDVGTTEFKETDTIGIDAKAVVMPDIADAGVLFRHDLFNLLVHETNHQNAGAEDFLIGMSLTYEDVTGRRRLATTFDLAFSPLNKKLFDDRDLRSSKPICEIRNTKIALRMA